jgi:hypothetical protein
MVMGEMKKRGWETVLKKMMNTIDLGVMPVSMET